MTHPQQTTREVIEQLVEALDDAATSLETISRLAGKTHYVSNDGERLETYMEHHDQVRGYAISRASVVRAALSRAKAAPAVGAHDACVWTQDTDYETDVHYSACGEAWSFIEGGPKENNVRFCQGCGKPVKLAASPKIGGV